MVMSPVGLGTKHDSDGEDQQQYTWDQDQNSDTLHALFWFILWQRDGFIYHFLSIWNI
jgi:hypothetical protein